MKKPPPLFIIVAYHPPRDEFLTLVSVLRGYPVVIVDNGGTPNVTGKDITVLRQKMNTGFGAGANTGIRKALTSGTDWCVILNQDVHMNKTDVARVAKALAAMPPAVAGPIGGALDPWRWTSILPANAPTYISGSFLAIHRSVIEAVGFLNERYFMYYEDVEYAIRARRAGFAIRLLPKGTIAHEETKTLGKGSDAHAYYLTRNHLRFISRYAPPQVKLHEYVRLPKTVAEIVFRHDRGALAGLIDVFRGKDGMFTERL